MIETENMLTVEEAATLMGVSVPTARRMAADGRITATKVGRQWLIDQRSLPRPMRRGSPGRVREAALNIEQALQHVRATDLSELPVPDVLRLQDLLTPEARDEILAIAESRFDGTPFEPAVEVEADKSQLSTRPILMPVLEDRVAYQAAVAAIAGKVEAQTLDVVYSARLADSPRYFLKRGPQQWAAWRRTVLAQLTENHQWMVKTDLTSYFDLIPHSTLNAEIQGLGPPPQAANVISEVLRTWAVVPGIGVPVGPNASRLLGNLYLQPVDREMVRSGFGYYRFLDDVRIVAASRGEAIRAIRLFERECRRLGLIVSGAKTQLLFGEDARKDLRASPDFDAAEYFANANAPMLARRVLRRILRNSLRSDGVRDARGLKFSLWRLARLREASVLPRILARLEDLTSVASVVAAYLMPFIQRRTVVHALSAFLGDSDRCNSPYMTAWILAAMLQHPYDLPSQWAEPAMDLVKDRNEPGYVRSLAAVVAARAKHRSDLDWIKSDVQRERDPLVLRGYAVGLHAAQALDTTTQKRLIGRDHRLGFTVDYLRGRKDLPSPVYPKLTVAIARETTR